MKTRTSKFLISATMTAALVLVGCGRQTRGNYDAEMNRAATPEEGGATLTKGGAGDAKNFGDTRTTQQQTGTSPSESPTGWSKDARPGETAPAIPNTPTSNAAPTNGQQKPSGK